MKLARIAITDILVPERLRAVEEEHAIAIAQSIAAHGLINPITVRSTPAAKGGKYTLVAGAHRLRGTVLNGDNEIDAVIVEADRDEAQLVEISENLFRNELSVADRAVFVGAYREAWERRHGKIAVGRPGNRDNLAQFPQETAAAQFSEHVADRMGISARSVKRLSFLAQNLHPDVRAAIRGTAIADNQSTLLKLAKMEPAKQRQVAVAFRAEGPDLKKALAAVEPPPPKVDKQQAAFDALVAAWARADEETKIRFVEEFVGDAAWEPAQ